MLWTGILALALVLAACGGNDPSRTAQKGNVLLTVTFDQAGDWEVGQYPADAQAPESVLSITDGRYQIDHRADTDSSFVWGAGGETYQNVIVEVDTDQLSTEKDNLYGVMCRLGTDDRGNSTGYALLISGDGHFGIAEFSRSSLDFLLKWRQSDHIKRGRAHNMIRAVCVDNYLAVYANGEFLGEVKDDKHSAAGQVGVIAGVKKGQTISIAFDNLIVYEGTIRAK
jgi:hypothetical protein